MAAYHFLIHVTASTLKSASTLQHSTVLLQTLLLTLTKLIVLVLNLWVAPLPFRTTRHRLPNNRDQVAKRLASLCWKNGWAFLSYFGLMMKLFESGYAVPAPQFNIDQDCWYLPIFSVYQPLKPGQIHVVFDSSASHGVVSLNNVLLSGLDLNKTLHGVIIHVLREPITVMAKMATNVLLLCCLAGPPWLFTLFVVWRQWSESTEWQYMCLAIALPWPLTYSIQLE